MKNRLAEHLTTWKWWYFVLGLVAFFLGSQTAVVAQLLQGAPAAVGQTVQLGSMLLQFIVMAALALFLIRLVSRRWPTTDDLALKPTMKLWEIGLIVVVFVVTHGIFWLLGRGQQGDPDQAAKLFIDFGFDKGLAAVIVTLISSVILAPLCEELLYRGVIMRAVHDDLARRFSRALAVLVSLLVSAVAFALPQLGDSLFSRTSLAYLITGLAFGLVYLVSGSLTTAMVSHSLQSCFAFAQNLIIGNGDHAVSPLAYMLVFGCPIWVFGCARVLYAILPKGPTSR